MIQFPVVALPEATARGLTLLQQRVNARPAYADQVNEGKTLFKAHNKDSRIFKVVRQKLQTLNGVTRRCAYCEDSMSDEVEHVAPKDLYPGQVFKWENYVYACGPCNGSHKRSKWKVFHAVTGVLTDVTRGPKDAVVAPVAGLPAFINPRIEDPMHFLQLDLVGGTGLFGVRPGISKLDAERAEYTRTTLGLNVRPGLSDARKHAFVHLRDTLLHYDLGKRAGTAIVAPQQQQRIQTIMNTSHRTVWREIIRQQVALGLAPVFLRNPEASTW